jgi:hypothetical protein
MAGQHMAKIVFSGGGELHVVGGAGDVEAELSKFRGAAHEASQDTGFVKFITPGGANVYVAADRVAYVEEFTDRRA